MHVACSGVQISSGACDNPGTSQWKQPEETFKVCWDKGIVYKNRCYGRRKFCFPFLEHLTFLVIKVATGKKKSYSIRNKTSSGSENLYLLWDTWAHCCTEHCPWFLSVLHQSLLMHCSEVFRVTAVRWERSFRYVEAERGKEFVFVV